MTRYVVGFLVIGFVALTNVPVNGDEPVSFRGQVAPILLDHCYACHGPKKAEGGYRVDTYERALAAGDSGGDGFLAHDLDSSEAFRRLITDDEFERMPLEGDPLPEEQIGLIRKWIEEGATFDGSDPTAPLSQIIPAPTHPDGPEVYPYTLPVSALAFSPDGQLVLAAGYHEVTMWNAEDGQLVGRIRNVGQRTMALAVSPDGNTLAVAGGTPGKHGETRLFSLPDGELKGVLGSAADLALDIAFHPEGTQLAMAVADSTIRIFDLESGEEQKTLTSHSDWVTAVAWNHDGTRLVSGSRDKTAKVYDMTTGDLLVTYSAHGQPVKGVAFHPEGNEAFSAGGDNKIHRWNLADGKKAGEAAFGGEVHKLTLVGEHLFASSADKTVRQFEAKTLKQVRAYPPHQDWAIATAFHPETMRMASGSFDGEVRVWNVETGEQAVAFLAAPGYDPASTQ